MKSEPTAVTVVIGICTFKRPEGLLAVLNSLLRQQYRQVSPPDVEIIVVDNAADSSIETLVKNFSLEHDCRLSYHAEKERGISQARNCFLRNIPQSADLVAFLDDDEIPIDGWLDELLYGLERNQADAISGPVLPEYAGQAPQWMRDGKFFMAPRRKNVEDYAQVHFGIMGNFLMRRELLEDSSLFFPEKLGLVGSEDSYFFAAIKAMNAKMTWSSKAIAMHQVPTARISLRYLLNREFRVGCGKILAMRLAGASRQKLCKQGLNDFSRLLLKLVIVLPACLIGITNSDHYERVKPLFDVWQFAGRVYGLLGFRYQQYK